MQSETSRDMRKRAAECERLAKQTETPSARETLLYVAGRWRALADEDERRRPPNKSDSETLSPLD